MIPSAIQKASSQTNLQHLLQVGFIQEAFYQLLEPDEPYAELLVVNHQDRYLSLSNEKDYIVILTKISSEVLSEAREDLSFIQQRKKTLVHLQQKSDHTTLAAYRRVAASQIRQQAERNGIPSNNLYLLLLEQVF